MQQLLLLLCTYSATVQSSWDVSMYPKILSIQGPLCIATAETSWGIFGIPKYLVFRDHYVLPRQGHPGMSLESRDTLYSCIILYCHCWDVLGLLWTGCGSTAVAATVGTSRDILGMLGYFTFMASVRTLWDVPGYPSNLGILSIFRGIAHALAATAGTS